MAVAIVMPGRRTVFGDGAGRHMNVNVVFGKDVGIDARASSPAIGHN